MNEEFIEVVIFKDLQQEAAQRDSEIRRLWADMQKNFYDIGEHAEEVYRKELFKLLVDDDGRVFEHGDAWLAARIPEKGRSTVYRARKMFRELAIIPREERRLIKQCNAPILGQLSDEHKRDEKWQRRAQELPEKEFIAKVKEELPEQHVDVTAPMKLKPTESQRGTLEKAITVAQWQEKITEGPIDREKAMEAISAHYLSSPCELEAFQGKTNEEAYDSQHDS